MKFDSTDLSLAKQLDEKDKLKDFRKEFIHTDSKTIYLDGNSLGKLPFKTQQRLKEVVDKEWGKRLIKSWNKGWYELSGKVGSKISKVIGAKENEVIAADSTSINLYKLVFAALKVSPGRNKIVTDEFNFPSDHYILQSIVDQFKDEYQIEIIKSRDGITIDIDDVEKAIDENTAVVTLSHAAFKSAFLYDMEEVTKIAHDKGAYVVWDLSHSVGAVDIKLNKANADMAIGCTYKYLNGGPGAPAFLYVREDLQEKLSSPIWGWFGDKNPFEFNLQFKKAEGIHKFLIGTPPIISLSAVDSSIDITLEAGIKNIREKSVLMTEYLIYLVSELLLPLGFNIGSPVDSNIRGSHVSIRHKDGYKICKAIMDERNEK
ncbi:MAG: kynureninase [Melioribacteraceae bacterium]|nr:kynureninase [Melioribacteraceae bacterium]